MTVSRYESTLTYLVWPIAELLVTIVCVSTPAAIRPLFLLIRKRKADNDNTEQPKSSARTSEYDSSWLHLDDFKLLEFDKSPESKAYPV